MDFASISKSLTLVTAIIAAILVIALVLNWIWNASTSGVDFNQVMLDLGYVGVFFSVMAMSAVLFLPVPVVAIVIFAANVLDPFWVGVVSGVGSAIGELSGYFVGVGSEKVLDNQGKEGDKYKRVKGLFQKYGFWGIVAATIFPLTPIDFVGLIAGALRYGWKKFLLAAVIGKIPRYLIVAYAGKALLGWML